MCWVSSAPFFFAHSVSLVATCSVAIHRNVYLTVRRQTQHPIVWNECYLPRLPCSRTYLPSEPVWARSARSLTFFVRAYTVDFSQYVLCSPHTTLGKFQVWAIFEFSIFLAGCFPMHTRFIEFEQTQDRKQVLIFFMKRDAAKTRWIVCIFSSRQSSIILKNQSKYAN